MFRGSTENAARSGYLVNGSWLLGERAEVREGGGAFANTRGRPFDRLRAGLCAPRKEGDFLAVSGHCP